VGDPSRSASSLEHLVKPAKRILFGSPHCLIDWSSGAAIATMDTLQILSSRGLNCRAFCASKLDRGEGSSEWGVGSRKPEGKLQIFRHRLVPVTVFRTLSTRIEHWASGESETLLAAFDQMCGEFRPDVLLTYGGHPVAQAMMRLARQRRIAVGFVLHNQAYDNVRVFEYVDHLIVPSQFAREHYRRSLRLECQVLANAVDWGRVGVRGLGLGVSHGAEAVEESNSSANPQPLTPNPCAFVTFVNPQPAKGLYWFARIAEQIARRRPDIPILVVESRGLASWLEQSNLDLSWADNLHAMANTPDPRDFYRVTKLLLMPSLVAESFGLSAAEAMTNGIPVLASNRGALPETLGVRGWGLGVGEEGSRVWGSELAWRHVRGETIEQCESGSFVIDIPERYTPEVTVVPTAQEVEPWVETIIRLWDDEKCYRECSAKARAHAQQWHPDRLGPIYADFFRNVRPGSRVQGSGFRVQGLEVRSQELGIRDQQAVVAASSCLIASVTEPRTLKTNPLLSLCMIPGTTNARSSLL